MSALEVGLWALLPSATLIQVTETNEYEASVTIYAPTLEDIQRVEEDRFATDLAAEVARPGLQVLDVAKAIVAALAPSPPPPLPPPPRAG